ncbi:hypothetical protein DEW08_08535 [Azospirillum thermophilum]|uniref:DUF2188 domain-containing protein n=2 Tax=Azospirillum thermophilum TaxID=2202148 RepID=A0A2S2CP32_9PROT|nr:hypothetical protein DEW08_08535 [Azospirillum thermophilum]
MPQTNRPTPVLTPAPCRPTDRRERSESFPTSGVATVPFFERTTGARPAANHSDIRRPAAPQAASAPAPQAARLGQVIHMASTGVWAVKHDGRLAEIDGRNCWDSREALTAAAERAGIALSSIAIETGSLP